MGENDKTTPIRRLEDFPPPSTFEETHEYPALIVPVTQTADLRRRLSKALLRRPKTSSVHPHPNDSSKRILLLADEGHAEDPVVNQLVQEGCEKTRFSLQFAYQDFTADEILRKILPVAEIPTSFEVVGKLAHVNLTDECLPYKYWIGKVILEKNEPRIRTVVNKVGTIETEYRTFGMEVIAGYEGEGWSEVSVKEEGSVFDLDFREVYWNSRLSFEHKRLVKLISKEAKSTSDTVVVADIMAGIGPFAVPLTSQGCSIVVHANDLNPASFKYLNVNLKKNRCKNLHPYNMDGREFVAKLQSNGVEPDHAIMNLPASAPEFLDAFRGYSR